jgi:ppGpp synthetase/RelA/SpoT-type nucleotidyltranferase
LNYRQWYDQNILKYEIITTRTELLLKHSLTNEAIDYSLINSRVKDYESFEEKMVRKKYI